MSTTTHAPPTLSAEPVTIPGDALSIAEAADRIGITRQSVLYLIDAGILPATRYAIPGQPRGMYLMAAADVADYARRPTRRHRGPRTTTHATTHAE